jgi:hypothetical protein
VGEGRIGKIINFKINSVSTAFTLQTHNTYISGLNASKSVQIALYGKFWHHVAIPRASSA